VQNADTVRSTEQSLVADAFRGYWRWRLPLIFGAALAFASGLVTSVEGAAITAGNLVVYRVGDGAAALTANATAVFLDEYTVSGTLVQSIPLSTTGTDSLTAVGTATTEGIITLSQNGTTLLFTGYRKDVGGSSPSSDPATTNRVIASVGLSGAVDTSIALTDVTGSVRSATTVDGSFYYAALTTGVRYVPAPGPAATSVSIDTRNSREVLLNDNILYASNGSTGTNTFKVQSYGVLPTATTAAMPLIILATADAVNGFALFDLDATVPGVDTMYCLSTVENRLRKYSFDGANWNPSGSTSAGLAQDLTGFQNGTAISLILSSPSSLLPFTDLTGYNGSIDGLTLDPAIATAGTNTAFRGIAYIPVPEPSTAVLCGLMAWLALGLRRARRQA